MRIGVHDRSRPQAVKVRVLDHDCYQVMDYAIQEFTYYRPTPQQIDQGTDQDETGYVAVCNVCGKDMPEVEV